MSGMVRRRWWIILQSMVVCGAVLSVLAARNDSPDFKATSVVQIRPDTETGSSVFETDLGVLMAAQRQVVLSASVLDPASRSVGLLTTDLLREVTDVDVDARSGTMRITVADQEADVAMLAANAVADSYVSQRVAKQSQQLREEADAIGVQLAELEARMTTLAGQGDASATALAAAKTQYDGLFNRQQDLLTRASLQPKTAEILTQASSATQKGKDSVLAAMALGALIGLGIGLLIALVREFFDDKVHHRQEVEKAARLPVIAELPFDSESASSKRRSRVSLAAIDRPASQLAEAIRSLRTAVTFLSVEAPIRCLTVTSGEPDEGKSLVAANLAVAYAQAGIKTILLSGDLRRPSLDARMLPQSARGFTDLIVLGRGDSLRGGMLANDLAAGMPNLVVEAHEVIYRTTIPNLSFVPAGTLPPNPAELLASKGAVTAIADLRQHCEMLIIDSPPTVVTDGVILADLADAVLLIAAADQSHAARISAAVEAVSGGHVRILGVVLNKLHERAVLYQPYGASPTGNRRGKRDETTGDAPSKRADTAAPTPEAAIATAPVSTPVDVVVLAPMEHDVFTELDVATAVEELDPVVEELQFGEPHFAESELVESEPVESEPVESEPEVESEHATFAAIDDDADLMAELELLARREAEEEAEPSVDLLAATETDVIEPVLIEPVVIEPVTELESDVSEPVIDVEPEVVEIDDAEPGDAVAELPGAALELEADLEPETEPVLEPDVVPEPVVELEAEAELEPEAEAEAEPEPEPEAEAEPEPEPEVEAEAEAEAEAEPEPEPEPEAEPEPEPARAFFPPPSTAPMTPPISLEQVRSEIPPPPMPRGGSKPPPPPPPAPRPKSSPPPPPRIDREQNAFSSVVLDGPQTDDTLLRVAGAATIDEVPVIPPTREIDLVQRRDDASPATKGRRERDRELRRLEKDERERQLRLGAELAKARRTMPRGFEARGEVGAEQMAELQRTADQQVAAPESTGPMTRAERKAAKRRAKELRLAAKLQAKDQRRKAKAQIEKSRLEAKRAIAEGKAAKQNSTTSSTFPDVVDRRTGPASPPS